MVFTSEGEWFMKKENRAIAYVSVLDNCDPVEQQVKVIIDFAEKENLKIIDWVFDETLPENGEDYPSELKKIMYGDNKLETTYLLVSKADNIANSISLFYNCKYQIETVNKMEIIVVRQDYRIFGAYSPFVLAMYYSRNIPEDYYFNPDKLNRVFRLD